MVRYFDFDGTLAHYDEWKGSEATGAPVPLMVKKVQEVIKNGDEAAVFTARLTPGGGFDPCDPLLVTKVIEDWCLKHIGQKLPVTNIKGFSEVTYDDKTLRIVRNTGLTEGEFLASIIKEELRSPNTKDRALNRILKIVNIIEGNENEV